MRMTIRVAISLTSAAFVVALGCGDDDTGGGPPVPTNTCTPTAVPCSDEIFQDLDFQTTVAPGLITSTDEGGGVWSVHVDATAGGFGANPPDAFVYANFADTGLVKVDLDDDSALDSSGWQVAFRRFIIRINSGASGSSCTVVAPLSAANTFDSITEVPPNLVADPSLYREDDFYTPSCALIPDTFGLGSPATAMIGYWSYNNCLEMTGRVFILELSNGRHVKVEISSYYDPAVQAVCEAGNWPPAGSFGSGNIRLKWAFLD